MATRQWAGTRGFHTQGEAMKIIIETVKTISGEGKCGFTIKAIAALSYSSLPQIYLNSNLPSVFMQDSTLYLNDPEKPEHMRCYPLLNTASFYDEQTFNNAIKVITIAADHLKQTNSLLKEMRENWHGEQTFVI